MVVVSPTGSERQLKNCRGLKPSMDCYELEAAMYLEEQECSLRKSEKKVRKTGVQLFGFD